MRISDLAERSGVSVATIKYYLREGLLAPGRKVTERLSEYDETHLRRLRLLRVLRDVGAVPVDGLRALVEATTDRTRSVHEMFGAACDALTEPPGPAPVSPAARELADLLVAQAGWTEVRPDAPGLERVAEVLDVVIGLGRPTDPGRTARYLELIDALARFELDSVDTAQGRESMLEQMVVGQVVYGELLLSLRRLAQEHHSALRFGS